MLPETGRFTFPKKERLCSQNMFSYLFENGSSLRAGAISVYYVYDAPEELVAHPLQVAFSAPKRHLKSAVHRNYIKRRLREAFRLEKHSLMDVLKSPERNLMMVISYNSRKLADFSDIHYTLHKAFQKLIKRIEATEK